MEYRGIEYTVVQGIERGVWKWSVSLGQPQLIKLGQAPNKQAAVTQAELVIDRAPLERSCGLSRPTRRLTYVAVARRRSDVHTYRDDESAAQA
jgi:hypothetical protein